MPELVYLILGPLTVRHAHGAEPLKLGEKLRLLLGRLLLEPGATLSLDTLYTDVWGEATEVANPRDTVHHAILQLRQKLGDTDKTRHIILNAGGGYRINVPDPLSIDAQRFKLLCGRARALMDVHPGAARAMLDEALGAWRGPLLGEHSDLRWARGHAAEFAGLRAHAEADRNDLRLWAGEFAALEADLRRQIEEHPNDERRRRQLVSAIYGAGNWAEAIVAYRNATLDLGAVGPELSRLGERIFKRVEFPPPAPAYVASADRALLCAVIADDARHPGDPSAGTLAALVDRRGGSPHVVDHRRLLATFERVGDALDAATELAAHSHLRAAAAVHAGDVLVLGDRVGGGGPARCWRFAGAARAGQVLVTREARDALGPQTALHDLGVQRFDDLLGPEPVFTIAGAGDPAAAPTLEEHPHNLPALGTRFVGREAELRKLSGFVRAGQFLTLVGVGGCGKTRLALALAARHLRDFDDGAWFVELGELESGADAEALAVVIGGALTVRALPDEPASVALARHLSDRQLLLVVDNCEHVLGACVALLGELRAACSGLCLIATSRQALRLDGERAVAVPAMRIEAVPRTGGLADAVELLLERASPLPESPGNGSDPLADAERICAGCQGWPLAIELAAGQVATRGLAAVAADIERTLRVIESDDPRRPRRQRSVEATIEWSHRLLTEPQRTVLHRLAIFRGSLGLAEAEAVAGDDTPAAVAKIVHALVDRSLVAVEPPLRGDTRVRVSQPIRDFALAQLSAAELVAARDRHARVYCGLAERLAPTLFGPGEQAGLERLEAEHDNLRAALAWLIEREDADAALGLVAALWWLWFSHGHFEEGSAHVKTVLALAPEPSRLRVRALRAGSHLTWWRGDYAQTERYNRELARCADAIGDEWGLAWAPMGEAAVLMFGAPENALALLDESRRRFQEQGYDWEAAYALQLIGGARWFAGDERLALAAYGAAAQAFDRLGHGSVLASARRGAGLMAAYCGDPDRGAALCSDALRFTDSISDRAGSAQALNFLGAIARRVSDQATALARFAEALAHAREIGELWATCSALDGIAAAAREYDEPELAVRLLAASDQLAARSGYRRARHERALHEREHAALRERVGARAFARATTEGQLLTTADAVAAAFAFAGRHA